MASHHVEAQRGSNEFLPAYPSYESLAEELAGCDWAQLTRIPEKAAWYRWEAVFREAYSELRAAFGPEWRSWLQSVAVLSLLPDAICGRRGEAVREFLDVHGFEPIFVRQVRYDWQSFAMDWRYQLNDTTPDRIGLSEAYLAMGPALFLLLRDRAPLPNIPAAVRLRSLKGASKPEARQGANLRDALGSTNRLIKFVHSADEPADVIRQLGILFDRQDLRTVLAQSGKPRAAWDLFTRELASLYGHFAEHDLSFTQSRKRLTHEIERSRGGRGGPNAERLLALIQTAASHGPLDWGVYADALRALDIPMQWDALVVASEFIRHKYDGEVSIIASDGASAWFENARSLRRAAAAESAR